ncbi:MAG: DUF1778 domain-containing protein [Clostridiales bacterium]|nr:DUF1778 domain-containing protein [Clostridiales bacterium]
MAYKDQATMIKYNNEFSKKAYDHIHLTVPKGQKETIQAAAQARGESVNAFIYQAILDAMEETKSPDA